MSDRPEQANPHASIRLIQESCTACNICARECPAWAIELTSHTADAGPGGRRARAAAVLDSFQIDFGTCLFCGICIEECPFDALAWSAAPVPPGGARAELVRERPALTGTDGPADGDG